MFFGFWNNKKNEEIEDKTEKIEIIDDKGEKKIVNKNVWIEQTLRPLLEDENNSINLKCDALLNAMEYGLVIEVIEEALKLHTKYPNNHRCVSLLFDYYVASEMYKEAIETYENFKDMGNSLTSSMLYDLALAKEKIKDFDGMEKNLYLSFTRNDNNSTKAFKKLDDYMKTIYDKDDYHKWLRSITVDYNSAYLYYELALLENEFYDKETAKEYMLQSLKLCKNQEDYILKIGTYLCENKYFDDFYNYIVTNYDANESSLKIDLLILKFYFLDNDYEKGLSLLKDLYNIGKYDNNLVILEKKLLHKKFITEEPGKAQLKLKGDTLGKVRNTLIEGPIYRMLFKNDDQKRLGKKILVLPFILKSNDVDEKVKSIASNIHLYLNEKIFAKTDMQIKAFFLYDDLGTLLVRKNYSDAYLRKIKEYNKNLDMILTGEIIRTNSSESFEIKIYTYDFSNNTKIERFKAVTNTVSYNQVINKFLSCCVNEISGENDKIYLDDNVDFMKYYKDYIDIIIDTNSHNKYKIYQTDRLVRYLVNNTDENKLSMALALIYRQASALPFVKQKYLKELNRLALSFGPKSNVIDKFNLVYGVKNENN